MKTLACLGCAVLLATFDAVAQDVKLPANLDRLADKAKEVVDVTLDGPMLKLAARFLSDKDPDEAHAKRIVGGLTGIYVRSFEFDSRGEYDPNDVEQVRAQLKSPAWQRIVGVRSRKDGDNAEIFVKTEGDSIGGMVVLVADPMELTIVNLVGRINPEDIRDLGGHFGIPKVELDPQNKRGNKKEDKQ